MNDLISRQAAIEAIDRFNVFGYVEEPWEKLSGALQALPSAQPEQRWIPCSERLPKKPTGSLDFFLHDRDVAADEYIVMIAGAKLPTSLYWTGEVWFSPYGIDPECEYTVIAWMPLPEPYKAESEE